MHGPARYVGHDASALLGWLVCILVVWWWTTAGGWADGAAWTVAALPAVPALRRGAGAWRTMRQGRRMRGLPPCRVSIRRLRRACRKRGGVLLGRGFRWAGTHAQKARELTKCADRSVSVGTVPGARWIHGLGPREHDIHLPLRQLSGHMLVLGTTGSGKTRFFELLVTQAVLRGEAVIVIDPKGDKGLRRALSRACRAAGRPERFVPFHPAFPERSARIDTLRNFGRGTELASRVAQLVPGTQAGDPFRAFAQMALNNVVQGMLVAGKRPTLVGLRRYIEQRPADLVAEAVRAHCGRCRSSLQRLGERFAARATSTEAQAAAWVRFYRERIRQRCPDADLEGLLAMFEHDRAHFSKMTASLQPILNMLTSGHLGALLSPDPLDESDTRPYTDSRRIINSRQAAYLGLDSLSDPIVSAAVGSLILADLAAVAGDRYNFGAAATPVNVFIDEAAEVMSEQLVQLLNKGRGSGMSLTVASQSVQDFIARGGSAAKAKQVLANANHTVSFRVLEQATRDYLSEMMPRVRLHHILRTQGSASDASGPHSGHVGERMMEEEGELFHPSLLGMLPDLEFVAQLSGGRVLKGRVPLLRS